MARAIWKGTISFGLVTIPVGLFSAVAQRELAFHLLDSRDLALVRNKRVNERTGDEVPWESIVKGYELPDGRWVTLSEEDFSAANVRATRTIDVLGAVCEDEIPDRFWETPYYLAPETAGIKAYALLRETLARAGRVAIGQIVIRSRQRLCAIVPEGRALMLVAMRYPYELRAEDDLELPDEDVSALGVTEAEVTLARQLVSAIESDWDPSRYHDAYHDDLLALIERKAAGETVERPQPAEEPGAQVVDIMDLLKKSVEEARKTRQRGDSAAAGA